VTDGPGVKGSFNDKVAIYTAYKLLNIYSLICDSRDFRVFTDQMVVYKNRYSALILSTKTGYKKQGFSNKKPQIPQ